MKRPIKRKGLRSPPRGVRTTTARIDSVRDLQPANEDREPLSPYRAVKADLAHARARMADVVYGLSEPIA